MLQKVRPGPARRRRRAIRLDGGPSNRAPQISPGPEPRRRRLSRGDRSLPTRPTPAAPAVRRTRPGRPRRPLDPAAGIVASSQARFSASGTPASSNAVLGASAASWAPLNERGEGADPSGQGRGGADLRGRRAPRVPRGRRTRLRSTAPGARRAVLLNVEAAARSVSSTTVLS